MTRMSIRVIRRVEIQPQPSTALSCTRKINFEKKVMRLLAGRYVLGRDILLTAIRERVGTRRAERTSNGTARDECMNSCWNSAKELVGFPHSSIESEKARLDLIEGRSICNGDPSQKIDRDSIGLTSWISRWFMSGYFKLYILELLFCLFIIIHFCILGNLWLLFLSLFTSSQR